MSNAKTILSIVTVVYNGDKHLEQTIESVLSQECFGEMEYIIIDGGSTDRTIDIIKKYESKLSYWISEPDKGIYDAMNKGVKVANGSYIGMINADDYYATNSLLCLMDECKSSNADVIYGDMNIIDFETNDVICTRKPNSWKLYIDMNLNHPATFIRTELCKANPYSTSYRIASDYLLLLNLKNKGYSFKYISCIFAYMRNGGVSATDLKETFRESYLVKTEVLGRFRALIASCYLNFRRIIRHED
jgi:glycosyltransferase involved in cell wall biosynthesis